MEHGLPTEQANAPSKRELELEIMLKERDGHIKRLVDDVRALRRHLPQSERTYDSGEAVPFPPAATSLLFSLAARSNPHTARAGGVGSSATVTAALSARLAALQTENDELYELLKKGTVARLHDEVKQLRLVTKQMGSALSESHTMVEQLKAELEQAQRAFRDQNGHIAPQRQLNRAPPQGPTTSRDASGAKAPPSGPRAQKRQRVEQPMRYDIQSYREPSSQMRRSTSRDATPASSRWVDDREGRDADITSHEDVSQNDHTHTEYDQTLSRHSQTPPPQRYSPEDDRRGRSRTRSPPLQDHTVYEDEPVRANSIPTSPRDFSYSPDPPSLRRSPPRSPGRQTTMNEDRGYPQDQPRARSASYERSPSPPRRSRSPSRVKHRERERDPRRERDRDSRSYHAGSDRSRHAPYHHERRRTPVQDTRAEREKERDRSGPVNGGGSNSGARSRRRGPRNGVPGEIGRRYGLQGASSAAGTLASRIK